MDLALLEQVLAELGHPGYRAGQVWSWAARGAAGYEAVTDPPRELRAELATRGARRHGEGVVPDRRRPSRRGGAHALSRRAPVAVPVVAVRLPAHLHVL